MFAERIKYLRQSKELNQVQFAQRLGVTKQSVSNWESDNIMPSIDMLVKIADFFDVCTDYLLGRETHPATGNTEYLLDGTGLTKLQIEHIQLIIDDLRSR